MALEVVVSAVAGALAALVYMAFSERFASGATWSGVNPGGGGPGFLLLLPGVLAALAVNYVAVTRTSLMLIVVVSAAGSMVCGAVFLGGTSVLSGTPLDEVMPLVSGVIGSYFVPRVVVAVLNDTWSREEALEGRESQE